MKFRIKSFSDNERRFVRKYLIAHGLARDGQH